MKNKIINLALAAAMVISSLSGMVIANAEGEPALADWDLAEATYTELFDNGSVGLTDNGWTLSRTDALTTRTSAVSFDWNRWVQYNNAADTGAYYYTYKIQMYNNTKGAQLVNLIGTSEYTVLSSPAAVGGTYEYTTVVDPDNGMAYTYTYKGELVGSVNIGDDAITGIKFQNTVNTNSSNGFWIYDFYYGAIVTEGETDTTPEPTVEPTKEPVESPAYDEWNKTVRYTELFDNGSTGLADAGWTLSRTDALTTRDSAVSFDWNRWVQYNNSSSDGAYYYTYKIQMYNSTEEAQLVNLVGASEYTVLSSPIAVGGTYEFTTVVDTENGMAYTYDYDGELVSSVSIGDDTITGIKFQNTVNTNASNGFWIYDFYYGTIGVNTDEPAEPTVEAATLYDSTDDEVGFVAQFTADTAVSSLTWYIDIKDTGYQKLTDEGVLPQIAEGSTVKIGLLVSGLAEKNLVSEDLAAGYVVE